MPPMRVKVAARGKRRPKKESPFRDSVAVAMGMYLEECLTASLLPLAGLHVLRCRALEGMASGETEACPVAASPSIGKKQDDSQRQRKRRRESRDQHAAGYALQPIALHPVTGEQVKLDMNHQIRWKDEKAFDEWTIPPEEAILKLMEQGLLSKDLPYHFVPDASRSWNPKQSLKHNHRDSNDDVNLGPGFGSSTVSNDNRIDALAKRYNVESRMISANKELFDIFLPRETESLPNDLQQPSLSSRQRDQIRES